MYMHADGSFTNSAPTTDEGYRVYVHDPNDPILTVGGSNMIVRSPDGNKNFTRANGMDRSYECAIHHGTEKAF
jgi:predicted acyl esterase